MKKTILLIWAAALALGSCVGDKGNYDYGLAEIPEVEVGELYGALLGENVVVEPRVEFSDMSKLRFVYIFQDLDDLNVQHEYEGNADGSLDAPVYLRPGLYHVILKVIADDNDDSMEPMEYYYRFDVQLGMTVYSVGAAILVSDAGQAKLHFLKPDGELVEDVYFSSNGEPLPGKPLQIMLPRTFAGGDILAYFIMTDNGGVTDGVFAGPNDFWKDHSLAERFMVRPASMANPGNAMPVGFNAGAWGGTGQIAMIMDRKLYYSPTPLMSPNSLTYESGVFDFVPVPGNYLLEKLTLNRQFDGSANIWGYDPVAKRFHFFKLGMGVPGMGEIADPIYMGPGSEPQFDFKNVGLDMVAFDFSNMSGWFLGSDGQDVYELRWTTMGPNVNGMLTKRPFAYTSYLTPETRWAMNYEMGDLLFSSGDKVYYYNPAAPATPEALVGDFDGEVTMLEFKTTMGDGGGDAFGDVYDYNTVFVGTEGHLYEVDFSGLVGSRGVIKSDVPMTGAPVDMYNRQPRVR